MTSTVGQASDYSFARRPKWVVSHVLVLALIAAMIVAGFWQVNRHSERGDRNERVTQRVSEAAVPLASIAPPGVDSDIGELEQFRRVSVTGEYVPEDEVLVRNRTFEGSPGWWVLTPFMTDEGWAVTVNRGWIPIFFEDDAPRPSTEPEVGTIELVGSLQPTRVAEGFQVADPAEGRLNSLGRPDVQRLAQQVDYELSPAVLQLEPDAVDRDGLPVPIALPALDAGPHASYAAQWFIFSAIAIGGYPLVLRRVASGQATSASIDD